MNFAYNGLFGVIILVLDVWAILKIIQSSASTARKVVWTVLVLLFPIFGFIVWFVLGPKGR